jgi:hypothetical protein
VAELGLIEMKKLKGFFKVIYLKNCLIYRPSDLIVSEDAGVEPRTIATFA